MFVAFAVHLCTSAHSLQRWPPDVKRQPPGLKSSTMATQAPPGATAAPPPNHLPNGSSLSTTGTKHRSEVRCIAEPTRCSDSTSFSAIALKCAHVQGGTLDRCVNTYTKALVSYPVIASVVTFILMVLLALLVSLSGCCGFCTSRKQQVPAPPADRGRKLLTGNR